MRKRINELFIPPKFEDKDKSRQASLLNSILIASILLTGFYIPILFLTDLNPVPGMIILSAMLVIFVGMYLVFRRGKVRIAASILMLVIWVITAVSSYFFDGVMGPSYVSLFLVVFSAGLLLGTEAAILYSAFTLSLGFVLLYLVNAGTLPQSLTPTTPQSFFGGVAINLVILVFFIALMNKNIRDSLSEAKKSQVELEESNKMLTETRNYLEETVEKNTRQLERRNKYLEAANMVARDTTSFLDPDELLQRVVTLISEQFDFYHVGIFIVDESNETAVLKAASSLGGQKMIARGHSLAVGKRGIVGFVTGIGQPRIAQNIGADQVHSATAELPETKSEMALPLKIRGEIIGAIDIQDTKENAFTDDDVLVLQTLADQVALAINNAELYQNAQNSIEEANKAFGDFNQISFGEDGQRGVKPAYRFRKSDNQAQIIDPSLQIDKEQGAWYEVPITVRGEVVGTIDISKNQVTDSWSNEEIDLLKILSDQLGIALENARLFEESQRVAMRERITTDVSSKVWASTDIDTILKTTVQELGRALNVSKGNIKLKISGDESNITNREGNGPGE